MRMALSGADWRVTDLYPSEWAWLPVTQADVDLENISPAIPPWRTAIVPGDVQSDLLDAREMAEPWRDLNSRAWEWTSQRDWVYWKEFEAPDVTEGHHATLRFEGVDYSCHVFLNGSHLGDHSGTYVPFDLDASHALCPGAMNRLLVVVDHAPVEPEQQAQVGWTGKVRLWKPRFAYKWDWCTRLIPLGIWDDVYLEVWDRVRLARMEVIATAEGSPERGWEGILQVKLRLDRAQTEPLLVRLAVTDADGQCVASSEADITPAKGNGLEERSELRVPSPRLWWPNGHGEQPLYRVTAEIVSAEGETLDAAERRVGFRRVRAIGNDGVPADALPYTLEVNGRRIFAKGWNWAPVHQLYGRLNEDRYRHAIRLARDAHCNLLRVWGGGLLERELFYDLCDEAGIMVWQEFPQSSSGIQNEPARDAEYVAYCREQAGQMVPRREHHPSLVIWCGGNELMDDRQIPNGLDHPVLEALRQVVANENPEWIYLPASPSGPTFAADPRNRGRMHDVHGNWMYLGDPDHYAFYNDVDPLFHSEFGAEGTANLKALERFLSPEYLWPPDRTNRAWVHHGAWWLHRDKVTALFGDIGDLRLYVFASQWMQYEGLRYIAEANRRRKWHTSGCAPWQFNESWPNTSCTNSLGFFGDVRPAYWAVRGAYAPASVSVRYDRMRWDPGSVFEAEVWLNVSRPDELSARRTGRASVIWRLVALESCGTVADGELPLPAPTDACALHLGTVRTEMPKHAGLFGLTVRVRGLDLPAQAASGLDKRYLFTTYPPPALEPLLRLPAVEMSAEKAGTGRITVTCPSTAVGPLVFIRADALEGQSGPYLTWGYAPFLMPGESVTVEVEGEGGVEVSALNAAPVVVKF